MLWCYGGISLSEKILLYCSHPPCDDVRWHSAFLWRWSEVNWRRHWDVASGYYTNYLRTSTALLWVALITAITTKWFMGGWHMQCEYTGKGMIRPFLGGTERDSKNVIMLLRTVWSWRCLNCLLLDHGWLRVIETMGRETANKGKLHYIISQKLSRDQQSLPRVVKALQFK